MFTPTRRPSSTIAALLALLAIGLRLLLPALHTHADATAAVPASPSSDLLLGGCRCDTFVTADQRLADFGERDGTAAHHDAAPAALDHACFACDFELAHPPLLPAPASMPATAANQLRAPPTDRRQRPSGPQWARPPTRAPPRTTACA